jgi:hypothetical protein
MLESHVNAFVERDPLNRTQVSSDEELIVISTTTTDGRCRESRLTLSRHLDDLAELGWQDRRYGMEVDPSKEIADILMDVLLRDQVLRKVFREDAVDYVAADLGMYDEYTWRNDDQDDEEDEENLDYTACSIDDCGYCGRCMY